MQDPDGPREGFEWLISAARLCVNSFETRLVLMRVIAKSLRPPGAPPLQRRKVLNCPYCSEIYVSQHAFDEHVASHARS
jgi:hypothetical protein